MNNDDDEVAALMRRPVADQGEAVFQIMKGWSSAEEFGARLGDLGADKGLTNQLGGELAQRGDMAGAEAAWLRADEQGDARASCNLGSLYHLRGQRLAAETAFRRADERGDGGGASNLGAILALQGDEAGAEAA